MLVLVLVTAPLALSGPAEALHPIEGRLNDACAEDGTCCVRVGSICNAGGLIDHYHLPHVWPWTVHEAVPAVEVYDLSAWNDPAEALARAR